jgi:hypothetical protein
MGKNEIRIAKMLQNLIKGLQQFLANGFFLSSPFIKFPFTFVAD